MNKEKYLIKEAELSEEDKFISLFQKFQSVNIELDCELFKMSSRQELSLLFRKIITDSRFHIYFTVCKLEYIGYFLATNTKERETVLTKKTSYLLIEQIYLDLPYRNSGLAKKMALKIKELAQSLNLDRIEAEVLNGNKASLNFLKNLGGLKKSEKYYFKI